MKQDQVNERIKGIVEHYGEDIYINNKQLIGLIADVFSDDEKIRRLLILAVKNNIPNKLFDMKNANLNDYELELKKLVIRFVDSNSLDEEMGNKAVVYFANGIGLKTKNLQADFENRRRYNPTPNPPVPPEVKRPEQIITPSKSVTVPPAAKKKGSGFGLFLGRAFAFIIAVAAISGGGAFLVSVFEESSEESVAAQSLSDTLISKRNAAEEPIESNELTDSDDSLTESTIQTEPLTPPETEEIQPPTTVAPESNELNASDIICQVLEEDGYKRINEMEVYDNDGILLEITGKEYFTDLGVPFLAVKFNILIDSLAMDDEYSFFNENLAVLAVDESGKVVVSGVDYLYRNDSDTPELLYDGAFDARMVKGYYYQLIAAYELDYEYMPVHVVYFNMEPAAEGDYIGCYLCCH